MISTTSSSAEYNTRIVQAEADNRARFELWLAGLVRHTGSHARFMNTLSLLEHIGSVKIARTQGGTAITGTKLQHLAEESRHAEVLKKIAVKLDPAMADDYADVRLMAGAAARMYFARLDARVRRMLADDGSIDDAGEAAYLLVTLLVECRAAWLYPLYQRIADDAGLRISVRAIIGEEDRHLADVEQGLAEAGLAGHPIVEGLLEFESQSFTRLCGSLYQEGRNAA